MPTAEATEVPVTPVQELLRGISNQVADALLAGEAFDP
jgi:hypothetical protein